jgi:hypothetical protein
MTKGTLASGSLMTLLGTLLCASGATMAAMTLSLPKLAAAAAAAVQLVLVLVLVLMLVLVLVVIVTALQTMMMMSTTLPTCSVTGA